MARPLFAIALEIEADYQNGKSYAYAKPYVDALKSCVNITDDYGVEDAGTVVLYLLSNLTAWRGDVARRVKAELKAMLATL